MCVELLLVILLTTRSFSPLGLLRSGFILQLVAEGYPALIPVGAKLHFHLIAYHYFNVIQAHLAGQVGQDHFAVFQLDPELGVRKGLYHGSPDFFFLLVVQKFAK